MEKPTVEYLLEMPARLGRLHIQKRFPEYYEYLLTLNADYVKFSELLYIDLIAPPKKCKYCGNPTKFKDFRTGYRDYCCNSCSSLDNVQRTINTRNKHYTKEELVAKVKQTKLERYGDENYNNTKQMIQTQIERHDGVGFGSTKIQDKVRKAVQNRYGVDNVMQHEGIRKRATKTIKNKFGVDNVSKSELIKARKKQTFQTHYGVGNIFADPTVKDSIRAQQRSRQIERLNSLIDYTESGDWICKCPHPGCKKCDGTYITSSQLYHDRLRDHTELCTVLLPKQDTKYSSMEIFIRQLLDKYNIQYISNDRAILKGQEIDIYIPDKKIAIECNGVYWHQTNKSISHSKNPKYHINKFLACQKQGVQLLTIWSDWFVLHPDIVESIIKCKLGLLVTKIYARRCELKEVSSTEANQFLIQNHIQGGCKSSIRYGLYFNNELVSLMTFGKRKGIVNKNSKEEWEIIRFCNKLDNLIVGAASKLFNEFLKTHNPKSIVSFASNDISNGGLYNSLGFITDGKIQGSYWYIKHDTLQRYHRSTFSKKSIQKLWGISEGSEYEIMDRKPYYRIYDTGTTKWIYYND